MSQHPLANSFFLLVYSSPLPQSLGSFCTDNQLVAKDQLLATLKPETMAEKPIFSSSAKGDGVAPTTLAPGPVESDQKQKNAPSFNAKTLQLTTLEEAKVSSFVATAYKHSGLPDNEKSGL